VLDLGELTRELLAEKWHFGGLETEEDKLVVSAVGQPDWEPFDRRRRVVHWLQHYKVLMSFPQDSRIAVAERIIEFADERRETSLHQDRDRIVSEFNKLEQRLRDVAPRTRNDGARSVTSLTSKALWCCYPEDVPIFDRNAVNALRMISRLCRIAPSVRQPEYDCFVDLWLKVYKEVEPLISRADLSDCPYRVRALDRMLWYLGESDFYEPAAG
jgi:hypothetical protein